MTDQPQLGGAATDSTSVTSHPRAADAFPRRQRVAPPRALGRGSPLEGTGHPSAVGQGLNLLRKLGRYRQSRWPPGPSRTYPNRAADEVVAGWHAAGVSVVLVTEGAHGATASTRSAAVRVAAPRVSVVDTVGAGDAFTAGAIAHLYERRLLSRDALRTLDAPALEELLQAACIVAADTCTRAGAEPPRRHQLEVWTQKGTVAAS
jgi:pfkB family carbohydrate kinase